MLEVLGYNQKESLDRRKGKFSATDRARSASIASLLRGAVAVIACAVIMSMIWGMNGVWLSFLAAELVTLVVILAMWKMGKREI